jgi:hypothetical protein
MARGSEGDAVASQRVRHGHVAASDDAECMSNPEMGQRLAD